MPWEPYTSGGSDHQFRGWEHRRDQFIFCCSCWVKEKGVQVAVFNRCIFTRCILVPWTFPFSVSLSYTLTFLTPWLWGEVRFLTYNLLRECGEFEQQFLLTLAIFFISTKDRGKETNDFEHLLLLLLLHIYYYYYYQALCLVLLTYIFFKSE